MERLKTTNNKILISSPSFKIGTNEKINLDGEKDKPDVKPKGEEIVKTKPNVESNKERKQDVKTNIEFKKEDKPDMNEITYEEEKIALVLGITSILQYGGCSNDLSSPCLCHEICVYQDSNTSYERPQILR